VILSLALVYIHICHRVDNISVHALPAVCNTQLYYLAQARGGNKGSDDNFKKQHETEEEKSFFRLIRLFLLYFHLFVKFH
jgi:hypothetical protein